MFPYTGGFRGGIKIGIKIEHIAKLIFTFIHLFTDYYTVDITLCKTKTFPKTVFKHDCGMDLFGNLYQMKYQNEA